MIIDAGEVQAGATLATDLCIIGAGPAGITIAREFAATRRSVLLLESGGLENQAATNALNQGRSVGADLGDLAAVRLRYFGGTSNHWAGHCQPLTAEDFDKRDHVPESGWPIGRSDLDPYYARAQTVCGLGPAPRSFDWKWWSKHHDVPPPLLEKEAESSMTMISRQRHFGERFKDEFVRAERLLLCLRANVVNLRVDPDSSRITGVKVATLAGNRFEVAAKAYVLATGGIEVPRLLLASNDVRAAGLGNEYDLVGRYFMEHLTLFGGLLVLARPGRDIDGYQQLGYRDEAAISPPGKPDAGPERTEEVSAYGILRPRAQQASARGLLGAQIEIGFADPFAAPGAESRLGSWRNTFFLAAAKRLEAEGRPDFRDTAALLRGLMPASQATFAAVRLTGENSPNPASRITLDEERDALGVPRVRVDLRVSSVDRESIFRALEWFGGLLGRHRIGRLQIALGDYVPQEGRRTPEFPVGVGCHHMGTTRMSSSPRRGVVDRDCRVHSVANLFIAGSAVFTTGGCSPPTLTIVALAQRLADHLKAKVL